MNNVSYVSQVEHVRGYRDSIDVEPGGSGLCVPFVPLFSGNALALGLYHISPNVPEKKKKTVFAFQKPDAFDPRFKKASGEEEGSKPPQPAPQDLAHLAHLSQSMDPIRNPSVKDGTCVIGACNLVAKS